MPIKEIPTNLKNYYDRLISYYDEKLDKAETLKRRLNLDIAILRDKIKEKLEYYLNNIDFDITQYKEYLDNKYVDGSLLRDATSKFITEEDLSKEGYNVLQYATKQRDAFKNEKEISFCYKILSISRREYRTFLRTIFEEAHRRMLNGEGFKIPKGVGLFYIARWKTNGNKLIDYKATAQRKRELEEQNARIYNSEEAKWCKERGIRYNAVDCRVWKTDDYKWYIMNTHKHYKNCKIYEFQSADYRGISTRNKTQDDLAKECKTIDDVAKLDCDLRCKLGVAIRVDPLIYTKFIRNESQTPYPTTKADSKSR